MVDNFIQINSLINNSFSKVPDKSDAYYHLQILQRKKENPNSGSNSKLIKFCFRIVNKLNQNVFSFPSFNSLFTK